MPAKPPAMPIVRLNAWLLRRGLAVGSQRLLTVRGRRTGLPRSTPVSIVTVGGDRFIVAAFADAAWVANVRAAGSGVLSTGSRGESVRLTEVPTEARAPILRAFLDQVRGGRRFFGAGTSDEVVAGAERYPVFRVESGLEVSRGG